MEKSDLVFCTSYEDETSADGRTSSVQNISMQARRHSSEGLPNDMGEISAVTKCGERCEKEVVFFVFFLQHLRQNCPSAVLLQSWLRSMLFCFSSFSVAGDINVNMSPCL